MVEQDTWIEGTRYMLADYNMEGRPWPTYREEDQVWIWPGQGPSSSHPATPASTGLRGQPIDAQNMQICTIPCLGEHRPISAPNGGSARHSCRGSTHVL